MVGVSGKGRSGHTIFTQGEGYRRRRSSGGERAEFLEEESEPRK